MLNFRLFSNIKITVLVGYIILFALAIFGLSKIYKELVIFSETNNPLSERKELNIVSNALVSLYDAESARKVILSENFYIPEFTNKYDEIDKQVRLYIDSLYIISDDENIHSDLDTVKILLDRKKQNFISILSLMDSIRKLPYSKVLSSTVITQKDIYNLGKLTDNKTVQKQDTSYFIRERRGFFDRVRAVFSNRGDSTKVVSSSGREVSDSTRYTPAEMVADTLVQYFNDVNAASDKRKIAFVSKLSSRQNSMLFYDEMLSSQIHSILRKIEEKEKRYLEEQMLQKSAILDRSSKIVSRIGLASIFVMIFFLPLTMMLINRNQRFRNELEASNKYGQKLLKSRERLMLMISHDVKAPLSSIIGHIELMSKEKMPFDEKEHLNSMRTSSEQILDLSNKLMDFHRLEQGKSEVSLVSFLPHKLLEDVYASFIPIANKKNLKLTSEIDIDPQQVYVSDPFILRQILNNLINNAIKYTKVGSVTFISHIESQDNSLSVSIKDTGVGIKSDELSKIFEEFGRVGTDEDKHSIDGFGLGLPITKKLVNLLNGDIQVTSEVGKGSEFTILIPMNISSETIKDDEKVPVTKITEKIDADILLVDDDYAILNVYSKLLEREGFKVITCSDSTNVLQLLQENSVDIIFTDIQMPQMNGFELVNQIRSLGGRYAELPIVALSGRSDISDKDFKSTGFTTFLPKPVSFDLLHNIVRHLVKNPQTNENYQSEAPEHHSPIGFDALIEYVKDDKDLSMDILNTFLEDSQSKVENLKIATEKSDWEEIKSISHKMLPLMTMIGEKKAGSILSKLERGEQSTELVNTLIPIVENVNQKAMEYIQKLA